MKRFLLVLMALLLIAGCSQNGNNTTFSNIPPSINISDNDMVSNEPINTESPDVPIRIYSNKSEFNIDFSEYYTDFAELISEKFNIKLEAVFANKYYGFDESVIKNKDLFILGGAYLHEQMAELKEKNLIIPITEYVKKATIWEKMPDYFKNAYKDENGEIWGIPFSDEPLIFARVINKEWLKIANINLPQTVSELYELLYAFTYNDPDQNGANDTYGMGMSDNNIGFLNFKDIF